MTRFRKHRKTVVVSFAEHEADILANLLRNVVELLYDGMPPRATESSDPLAALLDNDGPTSPPALPSARAGTPRRPRSDAGRCSPPPAARRPSVPAPTPSSCSPATACSRGRR